ncbi:MAG TPA: HAMP domain-containing sensor histidine kinase [Terracidiphilus sp.]|nr:HAMP domain-containing sensor histidine kinase [Terracidiphilus sp.]
MSSKTAKPPLRSAAWRISFLATIAFALGTLVVFVFLHRFVSSDIKRRSDAWLAGEVEVLGDVAERTPKNALYGRVVSEVAELAEHEVPNKQPEQDAASDTVFFLQTGASGSVQLWVGAGDGQTHLQAIQGTKILTDRPTDVRIPGFPYPFRVACITIDDGSHIYLGLSERDELRVLAKLRLRFLLLWLSIVFLGFGIVFLTSRRMLSHVRKMTEAASRIGHSDLSERVPTTRRNDEVSQLAHTLNRMLDRIESSMHQLHTITDALAHDLRSPLTAIRGKLEMSLAGAHNEQNADSIVSAIEELDQLTDFLNKSLDVAEARADALRLSVADIDLSRLVETMVDLYEPSMTEKGIQVKLRADSHVAVVGDEGLMHRMIANLLDNELKHPGAASRAVVSLRRNDGMAILTFEDNGSGFAPEVLEHLFARRVKGKTSTGHGLGLAFVDAVARAHSGAVEVLNREEGGALIRVSLPLAPLQSQNQLASATHGGS